MKKLLIITLLFSQIGLFAQDIRLRGVDEDNEPLLLLSHEGKQYELDFEKLNAIDPNLIESINVLKGESAKLYGSKAADGVVLISLKKNEEGIASFEKIKASLKQVKAKAALRTFNKESIPEDAMDGIHSQITIEKRDKIPSNMITIVTYDQKLTKVVRKGLNSIPADIIQSLSVYKDSENISKFDAIGKEGVVLIQLKTTKAAKKAFRKLK